MILKKVLISFGVLAILLTITPFIAVDYWWIRMFDFPHTQLTFLTALAILTYIIKFNFKEIKDYIFITILIACCIFQFYKILPYTTFSSYEVMNTSKNSKDILKIFTANVLQENEKSEQLIKEMKSIDADIMLFTEVNKRWLKTLNKAVDKSYMHKYEIPLDNTYGMVLYSKLNLIKPEGHFLVSDSIPSIHSLVELPTGDLVQIYAIHPTPPMPQENPMSTDRDAEMMMIAKLSLESKYPVIVFGDFNDVAWSQTSKLFKRVSRLLDARIGRGLYSTFSAKSKILRWPLDHIFISEEFRVKTLKNCNDVLSDHFPFYTELSFEPSKASEQKPPPPSKEDLKTANEQIKKFKEK